MPLKGQVCRSKLQARRLQPRRTGHMRLPVVVDGRFRPAVTIFRVKATSPYGLSWVRTPWAPRAEGVQHGGGGFSHKWTQGGPSLHAEPRAQCVCSGFKLL